MVRFKYERLTTLCFLCGLLGHADISCPKLFHMEEDNGVRGWGPELRVEKRLGGNTGGCRWLCEECKEQMVEQNHQEGVNVGKNFRNRNLNTDNVSHENISPSAVLDSNNGAEGLVGGSHTNIPYMAGPNSINEFGDSVSMCHANHNNVHGLQTNMHMVNNLAISNDPTYESTNVELEDGVWRKNVRGVV